MQTFLNRVQDTSSLYVNSSSKQALINTVQQESLQLYEYFQDLHNKDGKYFTLNF